LGGIRRPAALHDRGLGSSMCGYHLMDAEAEVADLLGIPGEFTQITMLAVGYTTQSRFQPAARPPVVSYVDRWLDAPRTTLATTQ
jgi:hypothetical protein